MMASRFIVALPGFFYFPTPVLHAGGSSARSVPAPVARFVQRCPPSSPLRSVLCPTWGCKLAFFPIHPLQICPLQICPFQICSFQICPFQICPFQICPFQICPFQICPFQTCSFQICS